MVLDASAVVAHLNDEPGGDRVGALLNGALISAVNLCEVGSKLSDFGVPDDEWAAVMRALHLDVVAFDGPQADRAIALRAMTRAKGLSLADRACLALAIDRNATAVTADRAWAALDVGCEIELIR